MNKLRGNLFIYSDFVKNVVLKCKRGHIIVETVMFVSGIMTIIALGHQNA